MADIAKHGRERMMLKIAIVCLLLTLSSEAQTTESCRVIHGRARRYCGDGHRSLFDDKSPRMSAGGSGSFRLPERRISTVNPKLLL